MAHVWGHKLQNHIDITVTDDGLRIELAKKQKQILQASFSNRAEARCPPWRI